MTMPLCACGCGQQVEIARYTHRARGYVKGEPLRYIQSHFGRRVGIRYSVDPDTGCWNWGGPVGDNGYGRHYTGGRTRLAHRWMYEQHVGPIPDNLQLDHLCENRACVNPDHLEPVTARENQRRRAANHPHPYRERPEVREAVRLYVEGENSVALSKQFGVVPDTILRWVRACGETVRLQRESLRLTYQRQAERITERAAR